MSAWAKFGICAPGAFVVIVFVLTGPLMLEVWRHGRSFETAFSAYSADIVNRDTQSAYDMADSEFTASTAYPEHLHVYQEMAARLGQLKEYKPYEDNSRWQGKAYALARLHGRHPQLLARNGHT